MKIGFTKCTSAMSKTSLPQRMAAINSREVQEVLVLQVKLPAKGGEVKKKTTTTQGRWSTAYSVQPHSRKIWRTPNYSFPERHV